MSEWRASTWGEEISLEYGKALRDYDKATGKYRVFGSNGPIGWTDKPLASGPGVILGRKGAYRGIEFSRAPFFVIDTAYYVVPKTEFNMRWLYYAIKYHKLGEIDDPSPIPSTTRSAVYVRDFGVPPLAEQKAIAAVLGALDDKIELNRRMNATLEAMPVARKQNPHMEAYLKGHRKLPKNLTGSYSPSSKEEALCYATVLMAAWKAHPAAVGWLSGQAISSRKSMDGMDRMDRMDRMDKPGKN